MCIIICDDEGFGKLSNNMAILVSFSHYLLLLLNVNGQVFEDASSFRGELKTLARQTIESEYDLFISYGIGHNSSDALRYTAERVRFYLEKGKFLRDEEADTEVQ